MDEWMDGRSRGFQGFLHLFSATFCDGAPQVGGEIAARLSVEKNLGHLEISVA